MRDEHWAHRLLSVGRVPSPPTIPEVRRPIWRWSLSEKFVLLGSVSGDGVRSVDLPRESSRHRSVPSFRQRQALPHGIPRQGGALDLGRCQRSAQLADLRRLRAGFDRHRPAAACPRSDWRRSGAESVRSGFDHHRPVPVAVSVGEVSPAQGRRQDAHLAGPARHIPTFIRVTSGDVHDVNLLDEIMPEAGSFYVMDRGYIDFQRLFVFTLSSAFFVVRTKSNVLLQRRYSHPVDKSTGVRSDQTVILTSFESASAYPDALRRVSYFDAQTNKRLKFLTNNFVLPALTIAQIYKCRWQVELFFKWIKQHLRIKAFYGTSENAVKTQIWIAVSVYVLVAIIRKRLGLEASLYQALQILSVTLFEKTPILCALQAIDVEANFAENVNQLILFDF